MKRKSYKRMLILGLSISLYAALFSFAAGDARLENQTILCSKECKKQVEKKVESSFPFLESLTRHFLVLNQ